MQQVGCIESCLVLLDYGLRTYRRDDGAKTLSTHQQRLVEVYMAPEFSNHVGADTGSYMEPTLAGDVFRYRTKPCQRCQRPDLVGPPVQPLQSSFDLFKQSLKLSLGVDLE